MFSENSWINQLNREYEDISLEKLDRANIIITNALDELIKLRKVK